MCLKLLLFAKVCVCTYIRAYGCVCMHAYAAKATVWHENVTWNIILRLYGLWKNHKIKFCKLHGNLPYILS